MPIGLDAGIWHSYNLQAVRCAICQTALAHCGEALILDRHHVQYCHHPKYR